MKALDKKVITVGSIINAPVAKVWEYWTKPEHIIQWNNASDNWHTPSAENDFWVGGSFVSRMEARNGSISFDFGGICDAITKNQYIEYTLGDGRKVKVTFATQGNSTKVLGSFKAENTNSVEMQQGGWQAILDNFKKYTENNS